MPSGWRQEWQTKEPGGPIRDQRARRHSVSNKPQASVADRLRHRHCAGYLQACTWCNMPALDHSAERPINSQLAQAQCIPCNRRPHKSSLLQPTRNNRQASTCRQSSATVWCNPTTTIRNTTICTWCGRPRHAGPATIPNTQLLPHTGSRRTVPSSIVVRSGCA